MENEPKARAYQTAFTESPRARDKMYDAATREQEAAKLLAVLTDHLGDLSNRSLLDASCSTGLATYQYAQQFRRVVGIDIDEEAVSFARSENSATNIDYRVMDALRMDFLDDQFDVVMCNQMYEHVPDPERLMDEIYRVLVPGGVCLFGANNRLKIMETHYGRLPFLSYLPKRLAHAYLRLLRRGKHYYETHYTYWGLKRLVSAFETVDYTREIIADPERFRATDLVRGGTLQQRLAIVLLRCAYWFFPGYIWVLRKPSATRKTENPDE